VTAKESPISLGMTIVIIGEKVEHYFKWSLEEECTKIA
jgi:hypothetical protein